MNNDDIKRSDAIEALHKAHSPYPRRRFISVDAIKNVPPAEVRPVKEGYWIENCTDYICSACGGVVSDEIVYMLQSEELPDYCPYCGAKMGGTP